jgi:cellulose synthase/poly-beta-1,6-N-acetylglucosamine synthase-like glycosyltransferase
MRAHAIHVAWAEAAAVRSARRDVRAVFWICAGFLVYSYIGYPALMWVISRVRKLPLKRAEAFPTVSIIIAARNEQAALPAKLANLRNLEYPRDRLQVVIVSDGSSDGTASILRENEFVLPVILPDRVGKSAALNEAVKRADGEVLVFLDVRQRVEAGAIRELVACFEGGDVGAVSGELMLEGAGGEPGGLGIYWKLEKAVRRLESASGSTVGVTGAIYAMRRELFRELPAGTILDDVMIPMDVVRQGKRVVFQPTAIAHDTISDQKGREFWRKVRTLTGNYQLIYLRPWTIGLSNPILFRFVSHKLIRLLCPILLIGTLVASALSGGALYWTAFGVQVMSYVLALLGSVSPLARHFRPVAITATFVMLNAAAALALYNFVTRRKAVW